MTQEDRPPFTPPQAELKHGRIAMLAWVGLVVPEFVRIPGRSGWGRSCRVWGGRSGGPAELGTGAFGHYLGWWEGGFC